MFATSAPTRETPTPLKNSRSGSIMIFCPTNDPASRRRRRRSAVAVCWSAFCSRDNLRYCGDEIPEALSLTPSTVLRERLEEGTTHPFAQLKLDTDPTSGPIAGVRLVQAL